MAYYRRRYRRYRPRRYVRRWFRRRFRRFVNGSSRSMIRLKVPCTGSFTWTQAADTQGTTVTRFSPFVPSSSVISPLHTGLYRAYCNLYDEVKCIGMKLKLSVSSAVGGSDIPSLQIYTAFDRRFGVGDDVPTFAQLKEYSTYMVATAVNNSVAKLERSCYASDLLEKAQWHDCSLDLSAGTYSDKAYTAAGANPNFFCPAAFIAMAIPDKTNEIAVTGTVDIMYYFAFRNPKYGGTSSNSKFETTVLDRRSVDNGDTLDLDEEEMVDAPPPAATAAADPDPPRRVTTARHGRVVSDRSDPKLSSRPLN